MSPPLTAAVHFTPEGPSEDSLSASVFEGIEQTLREGGNC